MQNPDPTKYSAATYAKLMFVLETLREADEETIHKVYVALAHAPPKVETALR